MKSAKEIAKEIMEEYIRTHRAQFQEILENAVRHVLTENMDPYDTLLQAASDKIDYFDLIDETYEAAEELIEEEL